MCTVYDVWPRYGGLTMFWRLWVDQELVELIVHSCGRESFHFTRIQSKITNATFATIFNDVLERIFYLTDMDLGYEVVNWGGKESFTLP